jgi:hypothetical protein
MGLTEVRTEVQPEIAANSDMLRFTSVQPVIRGAAELVAACLPGVCWEKFGSTPLALIEPVPPSIGATALVAQDAV